MYELISCGSFYQSGWSVIIVAKNEAIAKAIATDPYSKDRKSPTAVDQQLYLKEVSFVCPLCGKISAPKTELQHLAKKASIFQMIWHLYT